MTKYSPSHQGDTFDLSRCVWVDSKEKLTHLLKEAIPQAEVVVFDLETTGLDEHAVTNGATNGGVSARVSLATFTLPNPSDGDREPLSYAVPLSHPDSPWLGKWRVVATLLAKSMRNRKLVGHHVKFDTRYLFAMTGIDLSSFIHFDTQVSSHLFDENESTKLKEVAPRVFGIDRWDDVELSSPGASEREPLVRLIDYGLRDTYWTWKLYEYHMYLFDSSEPPYFGEELEDIQLGQLSKWVAMPTVATLSKIEQNGIGLSEEWVRSEIAECEAKRDEAYEILSSKYPQLTDPQCSNFVDTDPVISFAPTSKYFKAWSAEAVDRGELKVISMTAGGNPQWNANALLKLSRLGYTLADTVMSYRDSVKRLEFLQSWLNKMTPAGRIHATYNAGHVATGRLSSKEPNMQQVSRKLKPAFVPSEGYYLAELDYSQIELRVGAFISECEPMRNAFINGADLHKVIASKISGKPVDEVSKEERQAGKAANFGLLYGMLAEGFQTYAEISYNVKMTLEEANEVRNVYFQTWDGLLEWHDRVRAKAHRDGQVISPLGRIRRLPGIWDKNPSVVSDWERKAINSPVQGMGSDIMQTAGSIIAGNIPGFEDYAVPEARLVGTVHDSIMVEVPVDNWESVTARCKAVMESQVPRVLENLGCEFDLPLVADAEVGSRWGVYDVGSL